MRSFLSVVVMLALCLVSFKCTATGDVNDDVNHGSERQNSDVLNGAVVTTSTTTAAKVITDQVDDKVNDAEEPGEKEQEEERGPQPQPQPQLQPQPDHVGGSEGSELQPATLKAPEVRQPGAEAIVPPATLKDPKDPKDTDDHEGHKGSKPDVAPPTNLPTAHSEPGKPLGDQQQQQQQQQQGKQSQLPQQIPPHVSVPTHEGTGGVSHNQNHAATTRTSGEKLDTSHIVPQAGTPDARTGQPEHQAPEQRAEEQHSLPSHSTGGVEKKPEEMQPKKEQKTHNPLSVRSPPQGQPPTHPTIKSKTTVNDTTTSGTGAAAAEKQHIPPEKPQPTSTPAADKAVHQTATNTGDKETHTEQTSVSSTSEPEKGEPTPPTSTSETLSKAIKSLANKDTSIGSSLLVALTTLSTLVVMAVAPAC